MKERMVTDVIVIHCSATKEDFDEGAAWIDKLHRERPDMRCPIGYHAVIRRNGMIERGRPWNVIGAHTRGHNYRSIGICLMGGLNDQLKPENNFTSAQMLSLHGLILGLGARFGDLPVMGHRDLSPDLNGDGAITREDWLKECPCFDAPEWWKECSRMHWSWRQQDES